MRTIALREHGESVIPVISPSAPLTDADGHAAWCALGTIHAGRSPFKKLFAGNYP